MGKKETLLRRDELRLLLVRPFYFLISLKKNEIKNKIKYEIKKEKKRVENLRANAVEENFLMRSVAFYVHVGH